MMTLTSVGRIAYALPFGVFGIIHLISAGAMAAVVPDWIPGSVLWVILSGLALLAACVAIASQRYVWQAALGLAALLGLFIVTVHLPGLFDPPRMRLALTSLLKDTALAGAALIIAGVSAPTRRSRTTQIGAQS
ncbi:MAG: DoxX family protein [Chitinivibrionales bacterium]|nr:DoxX family protein [Chitinivibrionales bacterium]